MEMCEAIYLEALSVGWVEGWVLEDGAQRPPSYFSLPHHRSIG